MKDGVRIIHTSLEILLRKNNNIETIFNLSWSKTQKMNTLRRNLMNIILLHKDSSTQRSTTLSITHQHTIRMRIMMIQLNKKFSNSNTGNMLVIKKILKEETKE